MDKFFKRMNSRSAVDTLRLLNTKLKGDFIENNYGGFLSFDNDFGSGNGKALKLFPGLEVLALSVYTKENLVLDNFYKNENCLHFIYCIEGYLNHSFEKNDDAKTINRLQNVIIGDHINKSSVVTIDKETFAKFTIITILDISKLSSPLHKQSQLSMLLSKVLSNISKKIDYAYFGKMSNAVARHVEILTDTNATNLTNRLIAEASVFKVLAHQYSDHSKDLNSLEDKNPLSKTDSIKIVQLSDFISNHLNEDISIKRLIRISGLNEKKIQKGFQYFFDETVNKFITNLRILKAKELLENSDDNISEIVYKIGLNSRSYFSKIFYKKYGLIPSDYRKYHHIANPTFELSYSSKATEGINQNDLVSILNTAKVQNAKFNITGCLIYHRGHFLQTLEGPKQDVLTLLENIKNDSRNRDLEVIYKGVKSGRTFEEWNMALVQDEFDFSAAYKEKFSKLRIDFLDMINVQTEIKAKYIWEKARNYLIVSEMEKR